MRLQILVKMTGPKICDLNTPTLRTLKGSRLRLSLVPIYLCLLHRHFLLGMPSLLPRPPLRLLLLYRRMKMYLLPFARTLRGQPHLCPRCRLLRPLAPLHAGLVLQRQLRMAPPIFYHWSKSQTLAPSELRSVLCLRSRTQRKTWLPLHALVHSEPPHRPPLALLLSNHLVVRHISPSHPHPHPNPRPQEGDLGGGLQRRQSLGLVSDPILTNQVSCS
jgi:hypothetical protein